MTTGNVRSGLKTLASVGCLGLSGCAVVGPDYTAPSSSVSARFQGAGSAALAEAAQIAWWRDLNEPILNDLVATGLAQNLDIAASLQRIETARAQARQTGLSAQLSGGVSGRATRADNGTGAATTTRVSADARYVFDLFGGIRRGAEQAQANVGVAQFNAATVRLSFLAEIVSTYLRARHFQSAAEITRQTIASQSKTVELVQFRLDAGDASGLEFQQARQALDRSRADLPLLIANFEANVFRLATLLAEPAGPLLARMQKGARFPSPSRLGRTGVPADLLRNRPDIQAAERDFAASTAAIGVAEADLYPSLVLNGVVSETVNRSSASSPSVGTWSFGPTLTIPVLNRGILKARRDAAISQAKLTEITWRNTVLTAVEDVQSALSLTRGLGAQVVSFRRVTDSSTRLLELSRASYDEGASPITDVLDAERALSSARLSLLAARRDFALSWVELQIATGKGWQASA